MTANKEMTVEGFLAEVRDQMVEGLSDTVVQKLNGNYDQIFGTGKMLRSRLCFHVGTASGVAHRTLRYASAAVEMIHAASLLHDDVIDGGHLRRGLPTFWKERGIPGAILVGDLMLFKALDLMSDIVEGRLTYKLIKLTGEVCDAESEQELILRGAPSNWGNCIKIARRKTGSLFAFAAVACAGEDSTLEAALLEAGYAIGTAYQLADDILDATGTEELSGKSMGSDQERDKTTAFTALNTSIDEAMSSVEDLVSKADELVRPWHATHQGWCRFMDIEMRPAMAKILSHAGHRPAG